MQQQQQQQQQQQSQVTPQFTFEGGHLVMYHKEPTGLPQVKDANVNDRDRMQDLLAQEKYLTAGYDISMNEVSHDALYQVVKQNHDSCQSLQRQLFNTMFKKGWYKLPVADAQSVTHAFNQFRQYQSQFPFPVKVNLNQAGQVSIQTGGGQSAGQGQMQTGGTNQNTTTAQVSVRGTGATGMTNQAGSPSDQQLNRRVDQALREAEQGKTPTGYAGSTRGH